MRPPHLQVLLEKKLICPSESQIRGETILTESLFVSYKTSLSLIEFPTRGETITMVKQHQTIIVSRRKSLRRSRKVREFPCDAWTRVVHSRPGIDSCSLICKKDTAQGLLVETFPAFRCVFMASRCLLRVFSRTSSCSAWMSPRSRDRRPLHYAGAQPGLSEAGQGLAAPAPESPPTQRYPGLLESCCFWRRFLPCMETT